MKKLLVTELQKIQENKKISPTVNKQIDVFLEAMNDWPNPALTLEDYEVEVEKFIGGITTKKRIEEALIKVDLSKNSWQAESLTQIIEVFQYYDEGISLQKVISDLGIELQRSEIL